MVNSEKKNDALMLMDHSEERQKRFRLLSAEEKLHFLESYRRFIFEIWKNHPEVYRRAHPDHPPVPMP